MIPFMAVMAVARVLAAYGIGYKHGKEAQR